MININQGRQLVRPAAFLAVALLMTAPAALAASPGYSFVDFQQGAQSVASAPVLPQQRNEVNQAGASSSFAPALTTAPESVSRIALERHACAVVMGLNPSEYPYEICMKSLDESLSELDHAKAVESNRQACAQEGLDPGTRAFATCAVKTEQAAADIRRPDIGR